ncbi:MAG: class I tRNA ligase family protein, partial [bacterium]|nr:class I tRNA ligase family protein [bacterium]
MQLELDWLQNMHDWMISKKRYWGLALPIFECPKCGNFEVIGGIDELKQRAVQGWDQFEGHSPHRPHIDQVKIKCKNCNATVPRIKDVGNPWLDAGIVPYSTMGYLENRAYWEKWFPADFITECFPGQFRNWFYAILTMSTVLEDREPFKTVLGHALVRNEFGEEMHKSMGNAIWFDDAAEEMGVDTMRWMFSEHNPFTNLNFGYGPAKEVRKHLLTLWNTYAFWTNYAILDEINPGQLNVEKKDLTEIDRWMLAKLQQLISVARESYQNYNVMAFMKKVEEFIDDLSNWYVRRNRRRFWKSEKDNDKKVAYYTLHQVLVILIKLLAPIIPFITEAIYQNLVAAGQPNEPESVHHCDFPEVDESLVNTQLVADVDQVIRLVQAGRALRNKSNIKVRQPLSELLVRPDRSMNVQSIKNYQSHIQEELNIKKLTFVNNDDELADFEIKLDFKKLGPKYGKDLPAVQKAVDKLSANDVAKKIKAELEVEVRINGRSFQLQPDEINVSMKPKPDLVLMESDGSLIGLDIHLTDSLLS